MFQVAFEKSGDFCRLFLRGGVVNTIAGRRLATFVCPFVMRRVAQHHYQCLIVHLVKNVVNTPSRDIGDLPYKSEDAMGAFIAAR